MLKSLLLFHGIEVEQASADADYLVARRCLEDDMMHSIWCLAVDIDILVMLVEKVQKSRKGLYFVKSASTPYCICPIR